MNPAVQNLIVGYSAVVNHLFAAHEAVVLAVQSAGSGGARDFSLCGDCQRLLEVVDALAGKAMEAAVGKIAVEVENRP